MDEQIGEQSKTSAKTPPEPDKTRNAGLAQKLDAVGWGLFLIWLGIVLLAGAKTSVALLGIGIIMVGVQLARQFLRIRIEGFWFVVGLLFLVGSLWQLADTRVRLIPILLIVAGVALIVTKFLSRQQR
jgi:hypothetical protein